MVIVIVYHADVHKHLHPGMTIDVSLNWPDSHGMQFLKRSICRSAFPHGISCFGSRVLTMPNNKDQFDGQTAELMAELVRVNNYPNYPSRLTVLFASRSVDEVRKWIPIIAGDGATVPVYAIECNIVYIADAQKLDFPDTLPYKPEDYPASMIRFLHDYWRSVHLWELKDQAIELPNAPFYEKEELLVPLPARVLYQVE